MPDTKCEEKQSGPRLGVRRWGDEWFHPVQEEVPEGYIVDGFLFPREDVCEVMDFASGQVSPNCPQCSGRH